MGITGEAMMAALVLPSAIPPVSRFGPEPEGRRAAGRARRAGARLARDMPRLRGRLLPGLRRTWI